MMSVSVRPFRSLAALAELVPAIVYVMCGARGEVRNRLTAALPRARFLGFEPDEKAHQQLPDSGSWGASCRGGRAPPSSPGLTSAPAPEICGYNRR